jgi:hypothetical protein
MKREPRTSRIINVSCLACGALRDDQYAGEIPEWATAAASAR